MFQLRGGPGKPAGNLETLCLLVSIRSSLRSELLNQRMKRDVFVAWMYILKCTDDSYYVGSTKDLERRIAEHQQGLGATYTSQRLPIKLVYGEEYDRVTDVYTREKQVQGWRRAKREALVNGDPELLPALAKKVFDKSMLNKDNPVVE